MQPTNQGLANLHANFTLSVTWQKCAKRFNYTVKYRPKAVVIVKCGNYDCTALNKTDDRCSTKACQLTV